MAPMGVEGSEGSKDEVAQVHAGMGELQGGGVDHHVVDGDEVYIDGTVGIAAVGVTVGSVGNLTLGLLKHLEHGYRIDLVESIDHQSEIEKAGVGLEAPRLALLDGGESDGGPALRVEAAA